MNLEIEGRVALVMGASQGLGRGIAEALAREGVRVGMASRSRARLDESAGAIDGETAAFVADTGDLERMRLLPGEVESVLGGPIEILVTNTGGPPAGGALDSSIEAWRSAYTSLVLAPRVLIEATLPGMRERAWGRIVNVAALSVLEVMPSLVVSGIHRRATTSFLEALAREVADEGITINTLATGTFATERTAELHGSLEAAGEWASREVPAQRLGWPSEYGDLVAFMCSERAAEVTGAVIPIDGGQLLTL